MGRIPSLDSLVNSEPRDEGIDLEASRRYFLKNYLQRKMIMTGIGC
jgi:hypothetical protein